MIILGEAVWPCTVDNKTRCKNRKLLQNEVNSKTGTVTSPKCVWILAPWGPQHGQIQSHTCACHMCVISSFDSSGGLIRTAHTCPYLSFPLSNCTYNNHKIKNEKFLAYFMRILNSCVVCKFQLSTLAIRHRRRIPSDRLLFDETVVQFCIFAVVNCADAALSVFHTLF